MILSCGEWDLVGRARAVWRLDFECYEEFDTKKGVISTVLQRNYQHHCIHLETLRKKAIARFASTMCACKCMQLRYMYVHWSL